MLVVWTVNWFYIAILYMVIKLRKVHCQEGPLCSCDLETQLTSGNSLTDAELDVTGRAQAVSTTSEMVLLMLAHLLQCLFSTAVVR